MRVAVPCSGELRRLSLATGASLGFLLGCGGSGDGGLFSAKGGSSSNHGGSSSSGGSVVQGGSTSVPGTGGSVLSSGGSTSSSGGESASGGAELGGSATGGSATTSGGAASKATGGEASTSTGGAATTTGGAASGGAEATGGQGGGGQAGAATGGVSTGGVSSSGGAASGGAASGGNGGSGGKGCSAKAAELCDGIDNNCDTEIDEKACPAKCSGFALGGHGYMVCDVELNARKASALCEEEGFRLAWIESAQENAGLLQAIGELSSGRGGGVAEVSIGATDTEKEGQWHWLDGADFWQGAGKGMPVNGAYSNWAEGRPNNSAVELPVGGDCAVLVIDQPGDGQPGQWNDVECSGMYGVLCEAP